jgi:lactoylglutathione lyase
MIFVNDMARSIEFYRDKLGLPLKFESNEWSEFETGTTRLALHGGAEPRPALDRDESRQTYAGTCTIGFTVKDLDETFEHLKSSGVRFVMPPTLREGENIKLAVCLDPDGLQISLAEEQRNQ